VSIRVMSAVWELALPQSQKLILLAFADHADDQGRCRPSIARVAWKSGYSKRQAQAIARDLRRAGVLEIEDHADGGRGWPIEYRIRPEKGAKLAPFNGPKGCDATAQRVRPGSKRVRSSVRKGAVQRTKRESILIESSEPSRTVSEPSSGNLFAATQRGDPRHQSFVKFACESFLAKHGQRPTWSAKEFKNLSELLKRAETVSLQEIERRFTNYLASTDSFIVRNGYSLSIFSMRFDALGHGPIFQQGGLGNGNGKLSGADLDTQIVRTANTAGRHAN
jgi:hypothetical protein